ncbi:unnamed protein product [Blepharisma stoltei]|uniref:Ankyrin repeat domain-containing protein n=1 Tax=Blepharisma stoltei TaxID=1481888 RepID=A0AAU9IBA0_9CILI|nr:unnamed protein product [Blepharisma stoltei]
MVYGLHIRALHIRNRRDSWRFWRVNKLKFIRTYWGIGAMSLICTWIWGPTGFFKFNFRLFVNEKLYKYFPMDHGGNVLFPFSYLITLCQKSYLRTSWTSFDQRSFFPHSEGYKLKVAICHNDFQLAASVLNRGFDINSILDKRRKYSPLLLASQLGKLEMVEYLVSRGADLNARDFEGNTPLMMAVIHEQTDVIKALVSFGAKLDLKDNYGYTAIDKAESRGYQNIVNFLSNKAPEAERIYVNPVTYLLESYAVFAKENSLDLAKKYQVKQYFNGEVYPYFKNTQGMLLYLFGNYEDKDIGKQCVNFFYLNSLDDKSSTDQNLFSIGEVFSENMMNK